MQPDADRCAEPGVQPKPSMRLAKGWLLLLHDYQGWKIEKHTTCHHPLACKSSRAPLTPGGQKIAQEIKKSWAASPRRHLVSDPFYVVSRSGGAIYY